jgi:hypothetical protein
MDGLLATFVGGSNMALDGVRNRPGDDRLAIIARHGDLATASAVLRRIMLVHGEQYDLPIKDRCQTLACNECVFVTHTGSALKKKCFAVVWDDVVDAKNDLEVLACNFCNHCVTDEAQAEMRQDGIVSRC